VIDVVLSHYLSPYLKAMSPEQRAEVDAAHAAIHRAALGFHADSGTDIGTAELASGTWLHTRASPMRRNSVTLRTYFLLSMFARASSKGLSRLRESRATSDRPVKADAK
jgi:hypothetical protein